MNTMTLSFSPITRPAHIDEAEWALRCQIAECYHLVDYMGWTETIFNQISARLPGPAHHCLVNPFGLNYTEVTPANLLKVDLVGNKLEPSDYDANPAGFALHGARRLPVRHPYPDHGSFSHRAKEGSLQP